jgi:hypothetical protein
LDTTYTLSIQCQSDAKHCRTTNQHQSTSGSV